MFRTLCALLGELQNTLTYVLARQLSLETARFNLNRPRHDVQCCRARSTQSSPISACSCCPSGFLPPAACTSLSQSAPSCRSQSCSSFLLWALQMLWSGMEHTLQLLAQWVSSGVKLSIGCLGSLRQPRKRGCKSFKQRRMGLI